MDDTSLIDMVFMYQGLLSAGRSKDRKRQVGSVIAYNGFLRGIGYNGTPPLVDDVDFPWDSEEKDDFVFHAEFNAMTNSVKTGHGDELVAGATLYTPFRPCTDCSRLAVGFDIARVVYIAETNKEKWVKGSRRLLEEYGNIRVEKIDLDIEPLIKKLDAWYGSDPLIIKTPHIERAYGKRENYLSWKEYFSATGQLLTIRPDIKNATVIVTENNFIGSVLYNSESLKRDIARSTAYSTNFPSGEYIDMLRNGGVDKLIITDAPAQDELYKGMSISSYSDDVRKKLVHRVAHELAHQYYSYTGKDFIV